MMGVCSTVCARKCLNLWVHWGRSPPVIERTEIVNARPRIDRNDTPINKINNIRIFSLLNGTWYRNLNKLNLTFKVG